MDKQELREIVREVLNEIIYYRKKRDIKPSTTFQKQQKTRNFKGYKFGIKDTTMDFEKNSSNNDLNLQNHTNFNNTISKEEKKDKFNKILKSLDISSFTMKELEDLNNKLLFISTSDKNNENFKKEFEQISKKANEILNKKSISSIELKKWFKII